MWTNISNVADGLSIISAIITLFSAISIKKYYKKIVRQYSVEKLTASEQKLQVAKERYQQIKRMYSGEQRGVNKKKICGLYLDIDEIFDSVIFLIPTTFSSIINSIRSAKNEINTAIMDDIIPQKNEHFFELGTLLDNIYSGIKIEKEKIQKQNMK